MVVAEATTRQVTPFTIGFHAYTTDYLLFSNNCFVKVLYASTSG